MISFKNRIYEEELMDDLSSGGEEMDQTLRELETINKWLGGNHVTIDGIEKLLNRKNLQQELVIADLGCGGGDMLILIAEWAKKSRISVKLIGFDANPNIIEYAQKNAADYDGITFETKDIFSDSFKEESFDIVLCTLFTHHFKDEDLVQIFKQFQEQARLGVIINDLHRHPVAYFAIRLLTILFSKSPMVKYDGPLSVRRAFDKRDWRNILTAAEITDFYLRWKWAFRWQLIF